VFSGFTKNVLIPLLLRLVLAAVFIFHGVDMVSGEGHELGANWMPRDHAQPAPVQLAVAWGELIGGVALGVGFLTRLAALGIIALMAGAIATAHLPHGFDIRQGGYEYNVVIITICVCLVLGGPGPVAVDYFFRLRRKKQG
jgi:putative oxidoreductase